MIRTRRIGAELFAALAEWRAALRAMRPPETPIRGHIEGRDRQARALRSIRHAQAEARVMALLNDDVGLCSEDRE